LNSARNAKALRLEIHTVLKQVDYDYQRMQYNTVVSGAMKMINALEDFKALAARATGGTGRGLWHPLLRVPVPGHAAHGPRLWQRWAMPAPGRSARCALAQVSPRRWSRTRSSSCCRSTASCAAPSACRPRPSKEEIEAVALSSEAFLNQATQGAIKRVILVPGRLVNVVV
jgi:leucyl-tRNA synthetase